MVCRAAAELSPHVLSVESEKGGEGVLGEANTLKPKVDPADAKFFEKMTEIHRNIEKTAKEDPDFVKAFDPKGKRPNGTIGPNFSKLYDEAKAAEPGIDNAVQEKADKLTKQVHEEMDKSYKLDEAALGAFQKRSKYLTHEKPQAKSQRMAKENKQQQRENEKEKQAAEKAEVKAAVNVKLDKDALAANPSTNTTD